MRWFKGLSYVGAACVFLVGCSEDSQTCSPGATQECYCPGGGNGAQTCSADGQKWKDCKGCPVKPDAGADSAVPDKGKPDISKPDSSKPDISMPDLALPDISQPDINKLDLTVPDISKPDASVSAPGTWKKILPGTFVMGSPATEPCREKNKHKETQHKVTLMNSFQIQTTEVTQAQFKAVMGYQPSNYKSCNDCPVENVNWHQAVDYCNTLSKRAGKNTCYTCQYSGKKNVVCTVATAYAGIKYYTCPGYRLPTEAEWEYAYRATMTTAFYNGGITACTGKDANAEKIGWHKFNSGGIPHPVGKKIPNAWDLYDMAGNVYEWCHDWYQPDLGTKPVTDPIGSGSSFRIMRGGSWDSDPSYARAAFRNPGPPTSTYGNVGFRCVKTSN